MLFLTDSSTDNGILFYVYGGMFKMARKGYARRLL